jgi:hypothetical protein
MKVKHSASGRVICYNFLNEKKGENKMPLYVCDECGCVDNTACGGNYWFKNKNEESFADYIPDGKALCVECTPSLYKDGSSSSDAGKWHNRFPKKKWDGKQEVLNRESEK